jgi:hypothetical protein
MRALVFHKSYRLLGLQDGVNEHSRTLLGTQGHLVQKWMLRTTRFTASASGKAASK